MKTEITDIVESKAVGSFFPIPLGRRILLLIVNSIATIHDQLL